MNVQAYHLDLHVDFRALTFEGHLRIDGVPSDSDLVLNANGLTVTSATAAGLPLVLEPDPDRQEVRLSHLPRGTGAIELDYAGRVLTDGLVGLYRSRYDDGYLLTTQFAAVEARRLLPCQDRPDRKAVFHVTVTADKDLDVVFNTPPARVAVRGGQRTVEFFPTPRMSSYLLYLGIGHFDAVHGGSGRVRMGVFAPPGRGGSGAYALSVAERVLPEYERYYGIPYPLSKLDLVAVPEFWAGAMENWGAIAFAEMRLLVDGATSSVARRSIAETIAHEIAHMWFGNLVTMAWWDDIWLNESFATFMSYRILDRVFPNDESWSDFLPRWSGAAFFSDSLEHTHPIHAPVERPEEIAQIFDDISYGKGASVLRMLDGWLGEDAFRAGVSAYLLRYQYANARNADLWGALEEASGQPVRRVMDAWISRPGVPLLLARVDGHRLVIDQRRFLLSGQHRAEHWPVPVVARLDGAERRFLLEEAHVELPIATDEPPFLNVGATGFYRVLYDAATLDGLRGRFAALPAADRWAVLHDLTPFVQSGDLPLDRYLSFLALVEGDRSPLVIRQALRGVTRLHGALYDHPRFLDGYRKFLRGQVDRLGVEPRDAEPVTDAQVREEVVGHRVLLDDEFARALAARFSGYDGLPADLRTAVATAYVRTGGAPAFDAVRERLRSASTEGEMDRLVEAMASASDPALVARLLDLAERRELLVSLVPSAVMTAAENPPARSVTWEWLVRNLDAFATRFRGTGRTARLLQETIPQLGLGRESEVEEYFRTHPVLEGERGVGAGVELLAVASALRRRERLS